MANRTTNTPLGATEVLSLDNVFTHTPISKAVAQLPGAIARFVAAERDLTDIDNMFDPAISDWLSDADAARETLTGLLSEICAAPVRRDSDMPLRQLGFAALGLLDGQSHVDFVQPRDLVAMRHQFICPQNLPHADRINRLVSRVITGLQDLASLDAYEACDGHGPLGTCEVFDTCEAPGTQEVVDTCEPCDSDALFDAHDLFASRGRTTARDWLSRRNRSDAARHRDGYSSYSLGLFDDEADDLRDLLPRGRALSA